jgi:hypothetical protein
MPVFGMEDAKSRYQMLTEFVSDIMRDGVDFGKIPGTDKPTLLKPGAEKLATFFGLRTVPRVTRRIEHWTPEPGQSMAGFMPFFFYEVEVDFYRAETLITTGLGSCNSRENRYAWRWVREDRVPPGIDKAALVTEERGGVDSCPVFALEQKKTEGKWAKPQEYWDEWQAAVDSGKCQQETRKSAKGKDYQVWVRGTVYTMYRVPNEDIFTQVNTILKMAIKRAYVDGCLRAVNASEFFTQDIEDLDFGGVVVETTVVEKTPVERAKETVDKAIEEEPRARPVCCSMCGESDCQLERDPESNKWICDTCAPTEEAVEVMEPPATEEPTQDYEIPESWNAFIGEVVGDGTTDPGPVLLDLLGAIDATRPLERRHGALKLWANALIGNSSPDYVEQAMMAVTEWPEDKWSRVGLLELFDATLAKAPQPTTPKAETPAPTTQTSQQPKDSTPTGEAQSGSTEEVPPEKAEPDIDKRAAAFIKRCNDATEVSELNEIMVEARGARCWTKVAPAHMKRLKELNSA